MSHFNQVASEWDKPQKVEMMKELAKKTIEFLGNYSPKSILDFGCGTGLFGLEFYNDQNELTGIDTSQGMLDIFNKKVEGHPKAKSLNIDLEKTDLNESFDLIISSMAFHHLENPKAMLSKMKEMLNQKGKMAIIDLDSEDGTFHPDNAGMGVKHFGFSKEQLESWAKENSLGFEHTIINQIEKNDRHYGQFLAVFSL